MRRSPESSQSRGGFTLVELLVVITIIGILAALTTAAVIKAIGKGDELKLRNEISQMAMAVNAFKTKYQAPFLPAGFVARARYVPNDAYLQFLRTIWPRIGTTVRDASGNVIGIDVNWGPMQGAVSAAGSTGIALNGNQCLVLFLGGVDGISGLSEDPTNPFGGTNGKSQYEFSPDRLNPSMASVPQTQFRQYLDIYGTPYVYFSSGKSGNDYSGGSPTVNPTLVTVGPITYTVYPFQISGPAPNISSTTQRIWANRTSFQIISAGKDGAFHEPIAGQYAGGMFWAGGSGGTDVSGADNMANFHPTLLGAPSN